MTDLNSLVNGLIRDIFPVSGLSERIALSSNVDTAVRIRLSSDSDLSLISIPSGKAGSLRRVPIRVQVTGKSSASRCVLGIIEASPVGAGAALAPEVSCTVSCFTGSAGSGASSTRSRETLSTFSSICTTTVVFVGSDNFERAIRHRRKLVSGLRPWRVVSPDEYEGTFTDLLNRES